MNLALSMVVYGESGVGKTRLAMTTPAPRLFLDVEGRSRYALPYGGTYEEWDPATPPPKAAELPDTTVVKVRSWDTVGKVYTWLNTTPHPWKSLIIDSLTELQKRVIDAIAGTAQMQMQDWGVLLRRMEAMVRSFRDLTEAQHPLTTVLFTAMAHEKAQRIRPMLQGQLGDTLPYYVDVSGYLDIRLDPSDNTQVVRCLVIQPQANIVAKDGTDVLTRTYGPVVANPDIQQMLAVIEKNLEVK
jgi:hypothetical protein